MVEDVDKKLDKILSYLHNDEGTGTKGLIADFAEHKKQFNEFVIKYETEQQIKRAKIGVLAAVVSMAATGIVFLFKSLGAWFVGHFSR